MIVKIHIDRLVLNGLSVSYQRQQHLKETITMELEKLFAADELSSGWHTGGIATHTYSSEIQLTNNEENDTPYLGQQIARAVFEGASR